MEIILLQMSRRALYLTGAKCRRKPVFGPPQCFELPQAMRNGKALDDLPAFAGFVRDCKKAANLRTNRILFCLEDDNVVSKEYRHLPCKKKELLSLAGLEAETVLQEDVGNFILQNYEYGRLNDVTGKLTSSLFAAKSALLKQIKKSFSKCGLRVIKITPPVGGLLYAGRTLPETNGQTAAVLDFDFVKTRLILLQNGTPVFQRTFETVFDDILEIIMKSQSLSFEDAFLLVTSQGIPMEQNQEAEKQISVLLEASVSEAVRNIRMVLSSERLELDRLILCGGLSAIHHFGEFFEHLGLDIPLASMNFCCPAAKLPEVGPAAKLAGCSPACFITASGLLAAKKADEIDFLRPVKSMAGNHAANAGVLVFMTVFALCIMALEPLIYHFALERNEQDKAVLNDLKYSETKSLLNEQSDLSAKLQKKENDQYLLPKKSSTQEPVRQLFSQIAAKAKSVEKCSFDSAANTIAVTFTAKNYPDYLAIKKSVESNGYFEIAVPFQVEMNDGICDCSVTLRVKNPSAQSGGKDGDNS